MKGQLLDPKRVRAKVQEPKFKKSQNEKRKLHFRQKKRQRKKSSTAFRSGMKVGTKQIGRRSQLVSKILVSGSGGSRKFWWGGI